MKSLACTTILAAALLACTTLSQAQSYEWSSYDFNPGDTAFSGNLGGITFDATYSGPTYLLTTMRPAHYSPTMERIDGTGPAVLGADAFAIGSTAGIHTWSLTLDNFSTSPGSDTVLLLGNLAAFDNISDEFSIQAFLGGSSVSTAGWSLIGNYDDVPNSSDGIANVWDGNTGYLSPAYALATGAGPGSNTYLALLKIDNQFDSIVITMHSNMETPYDDTVVAIGRITPVPEPSSALLIGIAGSLAFIRRKRNV